MFIHVLYFLFFSPQQRRVILSGGKPEHGIGILDVFRAVRISPCFESLRSHLQDIFRGFHESRIFGYPERCAVHTFQGFYEHYCEGGAVAPISIALREIAVRPVFGYGEFLYFIYGSRNGFSGKSRIMFVCSHGSAGETSVADRIPVVPLVHEMLVGRISVIFRKTRLDAFFEKVFFYDRPCLRRQFVIHPVVPYGEGHGYLRRIQIVCRIPVRKRACIEHFSFCPVHVFQVSCHPVGIAQVIDSGQDLTRG